MRADSNEQTSGYSRTSEWLRDLSPATVSHLRVCHSELIFFNGRMNLISPRTELNADLVHFSDAILASRQIISLTKCRIFHDIGSGNGIPGIVMALLYPDIRVSLIDADARKVEFLKHIIARLELKNADTIHARLEDLESGTVKCAISRGFASISKALLMSRKAAALGCEFYHLKGPSWSKELAEVPSQILAHWEPEKVTDYSLPT